MRLVARFTPEIVVAQRQGKSDQGFLVRPTRCSIPQSYFGCGTIRRYGFGVFQPAGYFLSASSLETEPPIMTSSPGFQLAGVETWCLAVSWSESSTRRISSKLRPVLIG